MTVDYSDQTLFFNPAQFAWPVHIIGLGGIGSNLAPPLMKLGIPLLHIWDADLVEPHNIPAQLPYRQRSDFGISKAKALQGFAKWLEVDCEVIVHEEFVTADTELDGIVISGVDSMKSRMAIWEAVRAQFYKIPLYIDGRIGGEELHALAVNLHGFQGADASAITLNPSDFDAVQYYEKWLFPDSEGATLPCGGRTNAYTPTILAGIIMNQLALFSREEDFKTNVMFNGSTMTYMAF